MIASEVRIELILSDSRGIYIPRDFLDIQNICQKDATEITDASVLSALEGIKDPDGESYWEDWDTVCNEVYLFSKDTGAVYTLYQNGDLFAVSIDDLAALSDAETEKFWGERE